MRFCSNFSYSDTKEGLCHFVKITVSLDLVPCGCAALTEPICFDAAAPSAPMKWKKSAPIYCDDRRCYDLFSDDVFSVADSRMFIDFCVVTNFCFHVLSYSLCTSCTIFDIIILILILIIVIIN